LSAALLLASMAILNFLFLHPTPQDAGLPIGDENMEWNEYYPEDK
jgi:hypothetical protein